MLLRKDRRLLVHWPETGLEEINGDLPEADFWPLCISTFGSLVNHPVESPGCGETGYTPTGSTRIEEEGNSCRKGRLFWVPRYS
jgi:hypothetical protein